MLAFLQNVTLFLSQFTFVDWGIIFVVILCAFEGYAVGAIFGVLDIVGFLLAFGVGLVFYTPLGNNIENITHLPQIFNHALGFLFAAILTELIFRTILTFLIPFIRKLPWPTSFLKINNILGIIPGILGGLLLLSFLLTVISILPLATPLKDIVRQSMLGNSLVADAQVFERDVMNIFGEKPTNLLTFLTVEPQTNAMVQLDFSVTNGKVDPISEEQMVIAINGEREKKGLPTLTVDPQLQKVAEEHSNDMLTRSYFSHNTPEGKSPFDRLTDAGIVYQYAGENLAFSPSVPLAMDGLMQSSGHRSNILSPNFHKIGVGVISAGIYGEMFSQEFTD